MKNMGLQRLVLVDPPAFDLERARWMSTHARDLLDEARFVGTVEEAIAGCHLAVACTARSRRWQWPTWEPPQAAAAAFDATGPAAILFGQEDTGLDNAALASCQALLRIPTAGMASLNLSQAVLLISHAMLSEARGRGWTPDDDSRQGRRSGGPTPQGDRPAPRARKGPPPNAPAPLDAQAGVVRAGLDLLARTPYLYGRNPEQIQVFLSGLLQRASPTWQDLTILRGMINKTRWRIERGPPEAGEE